jgi:hypothetical protein
MRVPLALALLASLCACAHAAPRLLGPPIKAEVDYSCHTDADCAIKDVGNCCGRYPACVNKDSPTFPERVREACAKNHEAGVCGFPDIRGCTCVEGRCSNRLEGEDAAR